MTDKYLAPLRKQLRGLSFREQSILALGAAGLIFFLLSQVYGLVDTALTSQSEIRASLKRDSANAPILIERYLKLKQRHENIESRYKEVNIDEGALSYIENLIKTKAGIGNDPFTIKENEPRAFGGNYQQVLYPIKFNTTNLPGLVEFLREITLGKRPLVLSRLSLTRRKGANRLEVDMDVSSIRKAKTS